MDTEWTVMVEDSAVALTVVAVSGVGAAEEVQVAVCLAARWVGHTGAVEDIVDLD